MLKFILYLLFLFPLIFSYSPSIFWLFQNLIFFISFLFLVNNYVFYHWRIISYNFGVDILSYTIILLSFWIRSLIIIAREKLNSSSMYKFLFIFFVILLILILFFTFSRMNLLIFYLFFERSLIPTFFLILGWGYQPERLQAGLYLLFYTLFASLPILLRILYLNNLNYSLCFNFIYINYFNIFFCFSIILAFLVKIPIYIFHLWLPKAHVEAPISGSMILAGVLLKLGGYGIFRIIPILIEFLNIYSYFFIAISLMGGFYIRLLCLQQLDMKILIAYSSVVHMGLILSGILTLTNWGLSGALTLIIAHGLCSSGLFCAANINYERLLSRRILMNKGIMNFLPIFSFWWFLLSISNIAAPPTLNLLGEISLINSLVIWSWITIILLILISFFRAAYSLYLYSYIQHGKISQLVNAHSMGIIREYLLLFLHWIPINLLIIKSEFFFIWF